MSPVFSAIPMSLIGLGPWAVAAFNADNIAFVEMADNRP